MILVTDIITKVETTYDSLAQASRALNSTAGNITRYFTRDQKTPYKKRYIKKNIVCRIGKTSKSG